jgi:DNA uptake protein ComE-like DNA-binding protein
MEELFDATGEGAGPSMSRKHKDRRKRDLNEVPTWELRAVPGIGPERAAAIISRRDQGRLNSFDDLWGVAGVGPRTIRLLRQYFTIRRRSAARSEDEDQRTSIGP